MGQRRPSGPVLHCVSGHRLRFERVRVGDR